MLHFEQVYSRKTQFMHRIYILLLLLITISVPSIAQKNKATTPSQNQSLRTKYANAVKYSDVNTAISAAHDLLSLEGESSSYKDTLAGLYYQAGNYYSCHLICNELLKNKTNDTLLLALDAFSLKNLGAKKDAIDAYEKLFALSKNQVHGYQLAYLQYEIMRLAESNITINKALSCQPTKAEITFDKNDKSTQAVPLTAALYNLKGLVLYGLKDEAESKKAFDEALKIQPDFETAELNRKSIEAINKK